MIQGMSSLLKNGDWLRRKSNYPLIWRQCEVPIPLFQQAVRRGERAVAQESDRVLLPARPVPLRDELVLLVPALTLIALVSSQTEFSIHLRYVFPSLGLFLIFIGQAGKYLRRSSPLRATAVCAALFYTVMSCLLVYPNHLAYFNDFVGGPQNGHKHLLGSSLDWGQGTQEAITWIKENEPTSKVEFSLYSATLAAILLEQTQEGGSPPQRTETRDRRLILYSADRYSDIARRSNEHKNPPIEEVVKRFPSGRVLVRVVQ